MNLFKLLAVSALITISLAACGGGGGSTVGGTPDNGTITTADTVISGMATKGPITGTISIYALDSSGGKGSLLTSTPVVDGSYSANIGKYAGPVIAEVTGSYTDEATGKPFTIPADAPMRAALSNASGSVTVAVTPLTELAVQKAGTLTTAAIDTGNKLVSDIFKFDVINTQPVAPTIDAFKSATNQSQRDYALALAALSQLSQTSGKQLSGVITTLAGGIGSSGMTSQTKTNFKNAVTAFLANTNNTTGVTDVSATNLAAIGGTDRGTTTSFALNIEGAVAANAIKGLQFEVVIPAGLTVRSNSATGETLLGSVTESASVAAAQPLVVSTFSAASGVLTFGLLSSTGIGPGSLATITCDTLPGWSTPPVTAFSIRNIEAVDGSAAFIDGVNVTVK